MRAEVRMQYTLNTLTESQKQTLLSSLRQRFESHMQRHADLSWAEVACRLEEHSEKLAIVYAMEASGGEPDVIALDETGALLFVDCSPETPAGRRSLCYDEQALAKRKNNPPAGSAEGLAKQMGVEMLDEPMYLRLQQIGDFDMKTSSWIKTPPEMRSLGGALFGDKRYGRVFFYHNGADSYYSARAFRALVRI